MHKAFLTPSEAIQTVISNGGRILTQPLGRTFEHSIANIYFIPEGILIAGARGTPKPALTWSNFLLGNLLPITLGNIVGGVLFVATAYWHVHAGDGRKS